MSCSNCDNVKASDIECEAILERGPYTNRCGRLSAWCGFVVWIAPQDCSKCLEESKAEVESSTVLRGLAQRALRGRLRAGLTPAVQLSNPFDISAAFLRYRFLAGPEAAVKLLNEMQDFQVRQPGQTIKAITATLTKLASESGLVWEFDGKRAIADRKEAEWLRDAKPCRYEGKKKREERPGCCGSGVRVFDCALTRSEVWHTKCRTCRDYAPGTLEHGCGRDGQTGPVECAIRSGLVVTEAICARCRADTAFAVDLFATYIRNRATRGMPCRHRGEALEAAVAFVNGGRKIAVARYRCGRHGEVAVPDCWVCADYEI